MIHEGIPQRRFAHHILIDGKIYHLMFIELPADSDDFSAIRLSYKDEAKGEIIYDVRVANGYCTCECKDFHYRKHMCKHLRVLHERGCFDYSTRKGAME